jgi:uncharacterized SAM-binding protein YcdF (DUF218 family)
VWRVGGIARGVHKPIDALNAAGTPVRVTASSSLACTCTGKEESPLIAELVGWALSPLNWVLVAMLLAIVGWRMLRMRRLVLTMSLGLAVAAFGVMTPLVSNTLARQLESGIGIPPSCETMPPDVVVVLSGGVDRLPRRASSSGVLSATSRRRIERGVAYWQEDEARTIVMSGGPTVPGWIPMSALMLDYAQRLGVPPGAMRAESRSRTTWENAHLVASMTPRVPHRVALATSAMHMRRSVMAFEAAGFEVCPLPADRRAIRASLPAGLLPDIDGLEKADAALHEFVGNLHYEWLRWRSAGGAEQGRADPSFP